MCAMNADRVIEAKAPAKINLFLEVLGKRPDGYHEINSIITPVAIFDELTFEKTEGKIEFQTDSDEIPAGAENISVKAAMLLRETFRVDAGVRIGLRKKIPVAAGLGGGSSDAAATLVSLDRLWSLNAGTEKLAHLAQHLGADVPLFVHGKPAHIRGIGERVKLLPDSIGDIRFVIAVPRFGVSTKEAYARVRIPLPEERRSASGMMEGFLHGRRELVTGNAYNRLQEAAFQLEPRLRSFYRSLTDEVDIPVTMSGSGSAFFACCASRGESDRTRESFEKAGAREVFDVLPAISRSSRAAAVG